MSITVRNLVDSAVTLLEGTAHEAINLLAADLAANDTDALDSFSLTYDSSDCFPGVFLSMGDEIMLITAVASATNTVSVLRGQKGSTAAAHTAGEVVVIDPMWGRWIVKDELRREIRTWSPQVYRVATRDITLINGVYGYDLGDFGRVYKILDARQTAPTFVGSFSATPSSGSQSRQWPRVQVELVQDGPTDFPSGNGIILRQSQATVPGVLHVAYAAPFDVDSAWDDDTDLIEDVGLDSTMVDIPVYGIAAKLLRFRTPRRLATQMQGQPRDAQEVPALALMQAADEYQKTRDSRLNDVQADQLAAHPMRMSH